MISPNTRSAQAALDVARPLIVRLDERRHPEDAAADLIEGWAAVETALRAMIGGSSLGGQALVSEVRAQGRLDYPHAHALLGFLAARDRATRPDYHPTAEDVAAARAGFQAIEAANGSGIGANTGVHQAVTPGTPLAPPPPPRPARPVNSGTGGGAPVGAGDGAPLSPYMRDATAVPPPPLAADSRVPMPRRGFSPVLLGGLVALVLLVAAVAFYALSRPREPRGLAEGVAAYRTGDREAARRAFAAAATEDPGNAMARVYLGRLSRDAGDFARATAYLDTAIRLDTTSAVAFREMGQLQLNANRPTLAISFLKRALERAPTDRVAAGWMACALSRSGDAVLAERFYARAGDGDWTACRQAAATPPIASPVAP